MARGKSFWLVLAIVAAVGIGGGIGIGAAAFGGEDHDTETATGAHPSGGDHMTPLAERDFLTMMIPHHQSAVAMAEVALERATDPRITRLATAIISSQRAEIEQMQGLLGQQSSTGAGEDHMAGSEDPGAAELRSVPAAEFDTAFLEMMIPHHASAIVMASQVQLSDPRPEVVALAEAISAEQAREVGEMQGWLAG